MIGDNMKKIGMLTILLMVLIGPVMGKSITVINDAPGAKIYLNGIYIGQTVHSHPVDAGEYQVTVKVKGEPVFSERVVVGIGEDAVVNTNQFVGLEAKSSVVNYGAKQIEEKRLRKATKGSLGLGGQFMWIQSGWSQSGVSIRFQPLGRLGFQGIGWVNNQGDDEKKYNGQLRVYYDLEDTLLKIDNLAVVYVGAGVGRNNETKAEAATGDLAGLKSNQRDFVEAFIGLEFNSGSNFFWNIEFGMVNALFETETFGGIKNETKSLENVIAVGGHLYFN